MGKQEKKFLVTSFLIVGYFLYPVLTDIDGAFDWVNNLFLSYGIYHFLSFVDGREAGGWALFVGILLSLLVAYLVFKPWKNVVNED